MESLPYFKLVHTIVTHFVEPLPPNCVSDHKNLFAVQTCTGTGRDTTWIAKNDDPKYRTSKVQTQKSSGDEGSLPYLHMVKLQVV